MPLPRFTSGAMGRLTFRDLNEAFDAIDQLRKETDQKLADQMGRRRIVLARITGKQGDEYSWQEIERTGTTFALRANGRTSTENGNAYANPVVGLATVTLAIGDNVAIASAYSSTGSLFYVPIAVAGGGGAIPAIILGSTSQGSGQWLYNCKEAIRSGSFWVQKPEADTFSARNGAENVPDASGVYGVGSRIIGNILQTPTRQPIQNGIVVMVATSADGVRFFSVPNGYQIECAP
jgi:hypothetical protein